MQRWLAEMANGAKRMSPELRAEFKSIFWAENEERAREGRPLRMPLDERDPFFRSDANAELLGVQFAA